MKWHTEKRRLADLVPYANNPRQLTEKQHKDLEASLKRFDLVEIPAINTDGTIIAGHQRLKIMKMLGRDEEIDVRVPDRKLTEKELQEYNIRSNKNTGEWDWDILANAFDVSDLEEWGFDPKELSLGFPEQEVVEDEAPEVAEGDPESKLGEVYKLGRHYVMCGDATKKEDVEKLMDGVKADMVFTDPPYGIDLDTDYSGMPSRWNNKEMYQGKYEKVKGDEKPFSAKFLFDMFPNVKEFFVWGADYYAYDLPNSGADGTWYVWDKREDDDGGSFDKMLGSPFELCWGKKKRGKKFIRMRWASFLHSDATEGEASKGRVHPTQKPIALSSWFIKRFSKDGWNIIDLFGGSGSTLIAAEQTGRTCFMMELDPKYVDVIRKRYSNLIENRE